MDYVKDLYTEPGCQDPGLREGLMHLIPNVVSESINNKLMEPFSQKEVERALFSMGRDKAPGPDGFPPGFF